MRFAVDDTVITFFVRGFAPFESAGTWWARSAGIIKAFLVGLDTVRITGLGTSIEGMASAVAIPASLVGTVGVTSWTCIERGWRRLFDVRVPSPLHDEACIVTVSCL